MTMVSVIGLGLMGRPIARRLQEAGYQVRGWNRSPLAADLTAGLPCWATLEETAQAEICLLMLSDATAVAAVLGTLEPQLASGQLVIDMSSAAPEGARAHARHLAARGIGWVDAPVSGGPEGAAAGTLAIMAGGSAADVARARPLLEVLGSVVHVGAAGMGQSVKIVNQLIVALVIEAVAEGLTLAERAGVDPALAQQAMRGGFADSKVLQIHGSRMIARDYRPGGFVRLHLKDLRMAAELADAAGASLPHFASVLERFATLVERGDGALDHSALHKLLWE